MLDRYDQDLLLDYLEGELDADRRAELDALLAEDTQLAALMQAMAQDRAALRAVPQADVPGDLSQDLTQSLERQMLLDDEAVSIGPIPIARGRALPGEPTGGPRWGRIAGLSALAASVAVAAGIVVITMDQDPLTDTAQKLGETAGEDIKEGAEAAGASAGIGSAERGNPIDPLPDSADTVAARDAHRRAAEGTTHAADHAGGAGDNAAPSDGAPGPESLAHADTLPDRTGAAARSIDAAGRAPIALAVTEPRRQLVLFSEKPSLTQEKLFAYCVTNGIPIVQTNLPIPLQPIGIDEQINPGEGIAADPAAPALDNNFALLVDPDKLEDLVITMNNDVSLDLDNIGRRAVLSNHAAVVTDLPNTQPHRRRAATSGDTPEADDSHATRDAEPEPTPLQQNLAAQQTIELQLPGDLGSDYANTRNESNLIVEQRRTQKRYNTPAAQDIEAARPAEPAAAPQDKASPRELTDGAGEEAADLKKPDEARAHEAPGNADRGDDVVAPAANVETESADAPRPAAPLDPTRGNWLAPHLPRAETTPILHWLNTDAERPAQLVPVLIQRAPVDRVNSLRLEQQAGQKAEQHLGEGAGERDEEAADESSGRPDADSAPDAEPTPEPEPEPGIENGAGQ